MGNVMATNPGRVVTRTDFNKILKAWYRGGTQAYILSAFKATGIYALDRYAALIPGEERKKSLPAATSTDIAFLPLYSPTPHRKACHSGTPHMSPTPSPTEELCASGHTLRALFTKWIIFLLLPLLVCGVAQLRGHLKKALLMLNLGSSLLVLRMAMT